MKKREKEDNDKLRVQIRRIPEEGLEIEEVLAREWLDNIPEFSGDSGARIRDRIGVKGRLTVEGRNLRLRGAVETELATCCTRCGTDIVCPLQGSFEAVLMPGPPPDLPEELELSREDLVHSYYQGEEVDLNPFFKEQVALEVPIQPLCKDDCAGLCAKCGADLNVESCQCPPEEGDPRLSALRNLKIE